MGKRNRRNKNLRYELLISTLNLITAILAMLLSILELLKD